MRRDLPVMEPVCYLGIQELARTQAARLEIVRPQASGRLL